MRIIPDCNAKLVEGGVTLQVSVDGVWRPCPEEGGRIEFPGFNGMM